MLMSAAADADVTDAAAADAAIPSSSPPFYSYAREFDLRYVLADLLLLATYLAWIWRRRRWRWPVLRGLLIGSICYYIDAVVWYGTRLEDEQGGRYQREWSFECSNGVALDRGAAVDENISDRCELLFGLRMEPSDAYRLLKRVCDFMMTWSYSLIWFTWESIVVFLWIEGHERKKDGGDSIVRHSLVAFAVHFAVYPLSLLLPVGGDVRAVATRHMHDSEAGWLAYAAATNLLLLVYNVVLKGKSARLALCDTLFCWSTGCFQAFGMVAPLYLFKIRPIFEVKRFLYEVAFLINRGSAEHFLTIDVALSAWSRFLARAKKPKAS